MKKPKIRFIPYEGFAVKKSSGEFLDDDITAEAYEEMIDALIEARKELITYQEVAYSNHVVEGSIHKIEQALKKAGVE